MRPREAALSALLAALVLFASLPIFPCSPDNPAHQPYLDLLRYSRVPGMPPDRAAGIRAYAEFGMHCPYCHGSGRASLWSRSIEKLSRYGYLRF